MPDVEPVEKVNLARIRRVGRKWNLSGCSVYDDLMLGGQETPENHPLNVVRGFFYRRVMAMDMVVKMQCKNRLVKITI